MSRPSNVFKGATNRFLDLIATTAIHGELAPEAELARALDASRTTVRRVVCHAIATGLICEAQGIRRKARNPTQADYFDERQASSRPQIIERTLLAMLLEGRVQAGQRLLEADLARAAGASTAAVREFLIDFSRFGLVKRRPRGGWILHGFDVAYANELAEIRRLLELAAIDRLTEHGLTAADRGEIDWLIAHHEQLREAIASEYMRFPSLDQEFHAWIISHFHNRFAENYLSAIAAVFIYHYQWRRTEEPHLNAAAVAEHLAILHELRAGRFAAARDALVRHLNTSREAMLRLLTPDPASHDKPSARPQSRGAAKRSSPVDMRGQERSAVSR